jgi:hypothetical protein
MKCLSPLKKELAYSAETTHAGILRAANVQFRRLLQG